MTTELASSLRELHTRETDGIKVRMLWREHDDQVFVAVDDHKTGDTFSIEVPTGVRAMQVFHHPFAYAA